MATAAALAPLFMKFRGLGSCVAAGMSVTSMVSTTAPLTSSTTWAPFSAAVRDGEQREGQQVCHSHYRETRTQIGGLWRTGGVVCPFLADREASST